MLALGALSISVADAAERATTIALACEGILTSSFRGKVVKLDPSFEQVSRTIVVNWKDRIVNGFIVPGIITSFDDVTISFAGSNENLKVADPINSKSRRDHKPRHR
jgi:hypothetical protein